MLRVNYYAIIAIVALCSPITAYVSRETMQQLQLIEGSMDRRADPCNDFYSYACGNWTMYPANKDFYYMDHVQKYKFTKTLRELIAHQYPNKDQIRKHNQTFIDKALTVYYSCKKEREIDFLKEIKPGRDIQWPLFAELEAYNNNQVSPSAEIFENFDVFNLLSQVFAVGLNDIVISMGLRRQPNGTLVINMATPKQKSFDTNEILTRFDLPSELHEKFYREIQETHNFWQTKYSYYGHDDEVVLSLLKVKHMYPRLAQFLEQVLPNQLTNDDMVIISRLEYVHFLFTRHWSPSETQMFCNYIMVQFYKYMLQNNMGNAEELLEKRMQLAVNYLYQQHVYRREAAHFNAGLTDMTKTVFRNFMAVLNENKLHFTRHQLHAVKAKLTRLYTNIGNLPEDVHFAKINEHYKHLPDLEDDNCGQNMLLLLKQRLLEKITCPKNVRCGVAVATTLYNVPEMDLLVIPFSALSTPFYHWSFDPIFSVSLLGTTMAHEFTHSMDTVALMSEDNYEYLHKEFLSHPRINAAVDCMQRQQPTADVREGIAALTGARVAYRAYSREYNVQPRFTNTPWQQLFFLNLGQSFCQSWNMPTTQYDTNSVRLHQIAMNMNEFAEAFQCPVGSRLNPAKKCRFY